MPYQVDEWLKLVGNAVVDENLPRIAVGHQHIVAAFEPDSKRVVFGVWKVVESVVVAGEPQNAHFRRHPHKSVGVFACRVRLAYRYVIQSVDTLEHWLGSPSFVATQRNQEQGAQFESVFHCQHSVSNVHNKP